MSISKWIRTVLLAAALTLAAGVFPVMAAGSVSSIRITFTNNYEVGEILEPDITCSTGGVDIDSVSWSQSVSNWTPGKSVTATIILTSDSEFLDSYGKNTMSVSGADFSSAKRNSDGDLTVKVSYKPVVALAAPEEAGWSVTDRTKAVWTKVKYATGYEIELYRDECYLRTIKVTGTSASLKEYMTEEGEYYYTICAVGKDTEDKRYRKASDYTVSTDKVLDDLGDTGGYWRNYSAGRKYQREDGTYPASTWEKILGDWYYFNDEGYALNGWQFFEEHWYYLDPETGIMATGWQEVDGIKYYLKDDGTMAVGWLEMQPQCWCYFFPDGSMAKDTMIGEYYINPDGVYYETQ